MQLIGTSSLLADVSHFNQTRALVEAFVKRIKNKFFKCSGTGVQKLHNIDSVTSNYL